MTRGPRRSPRGTRRSAAPVASFAVDGGTLIIGIGEDKENRTFFRAPQRLKGLGEKVEQVARTLPDPPLAVVTTDIPPPRMRNRDTS